MTKKYIRDKRSPVPKDENTSRVMSANKAKDSKPEVALRKALWHSHFRGYRLHYKKVPGRPDISFVAKRVAVFVHGCFWHRCPKCNYTLPKTNQTFWIEKFERNKSRDVKKTKDLKKLGWKVFTVWECDIKKGVEPILNKIEKSLEAGR